MEGSKKMMKRPIKEVYGSDAFEGFNKGKAETVERYRALLHLSNEHMLSEIEWHQAASKSNSIASQIELLEEIIKAKGKFDFTAELEKLKEELMEADGMLADVKERILESEGKGSQAVETLEIKVSHWIAWEKLESECVEQHSGFLPTLTHGL
ncbi:hypothetical protein F2Q68_00019899 [Brassica cretica]|uniref:Uncharacterized protein n=1 Tax=Brassica cretica TaxID=69181 RepID=A0A8S9G689_BRACR|nr:hypothetical protein F2Q68_00019899 [Brassica cretica]